jgi:hypothetical protein
MSSIKQETKPWSQKRVKSIKFVSLEKAIEITNDLNRDMNLGEAVVTEAGIMKDDQAECQALLGRIAVEIDLHLETIDGLKGVKMPYRNVKDPEYNRVN